MAGHSKWSNIQHRKGRQDARRGRIFSKLIREITVAARLGGPDPASNPRLRLALDQAATNNVPKENLERAIQRGGGLDNDRNLEEISLEAFGPGGSALLIESLTDNRTRTIADVRHCLSKGGGKLVGGGDVTRLFRRTGRIWSAPDAREEAILEVALEHEAEDVVTENGRVAVYAPMDKIQNLRDALQTAGLPIETAECILHPEQKLVIAEKDRQRLEKLQFALEDLEDVQKVYSNVDLLENTHEDAPPGQ